MKTLYLLRHAKSSWKDESLTDFQRPLAPRGKRAAPAMGAFMAREGHVPDRILCSAARRALDTWDLVEEEMEEALGRELTAEIREDLYHASPESLLAILRDLPDSLTSVLMVGHNPTMEDLASALAGGGDEEALATMHRKYPTGALAILHLPVDRWGEIRQGRAHLHAFVRPRDLGD